LVSYPFSLKGALSEGRVLAVEARFSAFSALEAVSLGARVLASFIAV
jgi:hypothetical protein